MLCKQDKGKGWRNLTGAKTFYRLHNTLSWKLISQSGILHELSIDPLGQFLVPRISGPKNGNVLKFMGPETDILCDILANKMTYFVNFFVSFWDCDL